MRLVPETLASLDQTLTFLLEAWTKPTLEGRNLLSRENSAPKIHSLKSEEGYPPAKTYKIKLRNKSNAEPDPTPEFTKQTIVCSSGLLIKSKLKRNQNLKIQWKLQIIPCKSGCISGESEFETRNNLNQNPSLLLPSLERWIKCGDQEYFNQQITPSIMMSGHVLELSIQLRNHS